METLTAFIQKRDLKGLQQYLKQDPQILYRVNEQSLSPLMIAAYHRFDEAVNYIASQMTNMTLYEAVVYGDKTETQRQLLNDPGIKDRYAPDGFTPLGLACFFGKKDIVELLLEMQADVNKSSNNDFHVAPLHSAVAGNYAEITALLLAHGADPDLPQQKGIRPVHAAALHGMADILGLLKKYNANFNLKDDNGKLAAGYAREGGFEELYQSVKRHEK